MVAVGGGDEGACPGAVGGGGAKRGIVCPLWEEPRPLCQDPAQGVCASQRFKGIEAEAITFVFHIQLPQTQPCCQPV